MFDELLLLYVVAQLQGMWKIYVSHFWHSVWLEEIYVQTIGQAQDDSPPPTHSKHL